MKKIHTLEQLTQFLDAELSWRKKELSVYKLLLDGINDPGDVQKCLCRGGTALLYAHWEGFIKSAAEGYLRFLATQTINYELLSNNFLAVSLKGNLHQVIESKNILKHMEMVDFFRTQLGLPSRIPWDSAIKTRSNLSSSVLKEIIQILGLDYSAYETKRMLIDERLVKKRNVIAHGEYLDLSQSEFGELQEEVFKLMDLFRSQIYSAVDTKSYLRILP